MKDFTKIVKIGSSNPEWAPRKFATYCNIKFKEGKLSITGVEGPKNNGDCFGSCGQIYDHIEIDTFANGWDKETLGKFISVWKNYHLNDMCAYNKEMLALGWDKIAKTECLKYKYMLADNERTLQKDLKARAIESAREGENLKFTPAEIRILDLPLSCEVVATDLEKEPKTPFGMKREKDLWGHNKGGLKTPEKTTLGWVRPSEHEKGLLGRKVNEKDNHGYGGKWWMHKVPQEAIGFLLSLPSTDSTPAWI